MTEIRQNKATRQWVIYSTARAKRPHDFVRPARETRPVLPEYDPHCPFCPGNEAMLPPIISEMPAITGDSWQTRIVPNKFPALMPEGGRDRVPRGIYLAMQGHGRHEVIIEGPRHNRDISQMTAEEIGIVIETYFRHYMALMKVHENMLVLIFRNHGERAGTSLMHPHSQIIVTGIVPPLVREREEQAQRYFDEWGRCVFCEMIEFEREHRARVIFENESFLGFVPFAAEVPFEIWIMPKEHQADFGAISSGQKTALAEALHDVLGRLHTKLSDPDYNYIINSSSQCHFCEPHIHWYLQVRPRLVTPAGFEFGTGISINPSLPESDAAFLNQKNH
jgi:UDPglucose--hexose-1-phosphate uridylyltransferase